MDFEAVGRKDLYRLNVKFRNLHSLAGVKVSMWTESFGEGSSPWGCWRSLYKPPVVKRTGDLQWRIVHGAVTTKRYLAHLDPSIGASCLFCLESETVYHLFVQCLRLGEMFMQLQRWFSSLGEGFLYSFFIFDPRYCARRKAVQQLINFLSGKAKLAIWKTRKNRVRGLGSEDVVSMMAGLVAAWLRVAFSYYKITEQTEVFVRMWGVNDVLCSVRDNLLTVNLSY